MATTITIDVKKDAPMFRLPRGVKARLTQLLDKQDSGARLTRAERSEAEGLVEIAHWVSLLKIRAESAKRNGKSR